MTILLIVLAVPVVFVALLFGLVYAAIKCGLYKEVDHLRDVLT